LYVTVYLHYYFITAQDVDGDDDGDITGGWVHPGEYASSGNAKNYADPARLFLFCFV
jgi:hypothetical protein